MGAFNELDIQLQEQDFLIYTVDFMKCTVRVLYNDSDTKHGARLLADIVDNTGCLVDYVKDIKTENRDIVIELDKFMIGKLLKDMANDYLKNLLKGLTMNYVGGIIDSIDYNNNNE